ncbi:pyruvate dehydrogenase complex dihydrolipoamide acetyltransferase [Chlamydia avium]|uniref:Acetyltransferase component of pyruvate dehydrogenase complex n=1 Tax=Chlamydia avium 10DC88 TaxID=1229831 RepID=W8JQQ2_9CHLA|nr:pyruvate dehydrogenase complex dihydrolipoamide acetyltransferase [Chlamydia avium]AHK63153.1 Dihydrolipoyllysine-residue acetyltransferase component of pyruvate dehydrogenase complex [Chlamydia avium 10DC88]
MISLLKMPKLSPTMEVGTIVKWHKTSCDKIEFGDVLVEISTDKAVLEYTASEEGWFREVLAQHGEKIAIGTPIAIISTEKDEPFNIDDLLPKTSSPTPSKNLEEDIISSPDQVSKTISSSPKVAVVGFRPEPPLSSPLALKQDIGKSPISPLAKRIAKEKNLDTSGIQGSGPGGRIVKKDLENAPLKGIAGFGYPEAPSVHPGSYHEENLSPIREIIAERLQAAKTFIPHFYISQKVYFTPLLSLLKELQSQGIKLSINDCIVRACALALKEFPSINSGFNSIDNKIVRFETIDISIAVAIPDGIITPIVRCADRKNIGMISAEIKNLVSKARSQTLKEEEYKGGSFCISNLGMTGITEFTAIIHPPQAAILAVGSVIEEAIVIDGEITIGSTCMLTLSVDHRVVDGYPAAQFIKRIQKILEAPSVLLLN